MTQALDKDDEIDLYRKGELFVVHTQHFKPRLVARVGSRLRSWSYRWRIMRYLGVYFGAAEMISRDVDTATGTTVCVDVDSEPGYDEDINIIW